MLSVLTYLWPGGGLSKREYEPHYVNVEARMFARHLKIPHRFVCVTDFEGGFDPGVTVVRTPPAARAIAEIKTPEAGRFPSCYRRLWSWSKEAAELGEWLLVVDIDLVLTGEITHLVQHSHDFLAWRPRMCWGNVNRVAGGLYLLRAGSRPRVWNDFIADPAAAIARARAAGYRGSDQAWISYCESAGAAVWPADSGIYSIRDLRNGAAPLPRDARLVQFNGPVKPWQSPLRWVKESWQ